MSDEGLPTGEGRPRRDVGGGRGRRRLILLGCLLLVLAAAVPLLRQCGGPGAAPGSWVFAVCDVGQGDALFLADGPHTAVAVDTGPDPGKEDACARRLGITDVPLVVLTHFHADHIDGLSGLMQGRHIGRIETTTVDDPPAGAAQVARLAAAAHVPEVRVRPDEQRTIGPISWRVLWPQAEHPLVPPTGGDGGGGGGMGMGMGMSGGGGGMGMRVAGESGRGGGGSSGGAGGSMVEDGPGENSGPNNDSIVMAVTIAPAGSGDSGAPGGSGAASGSGSPLRILLTGDIETPVQQILYADRRRYLPADVLKVPHHGSAKQDPDFLAAVRPSLSVISVGAGNPYGHPAAKTVYLAGAGGARVYRTDLDGMVLISAPENPDGPIPVRADKGDGSVSTAMPSPTGHGAKYGGHSRRGSGSGHHHAPQHTGDP